MCLMHFVEEDPIFPTKPKQARDFTKTTWLADSGASTHMTHSDVGMFNVRPCNSRIKIGNGKVVTATKEGDLRVEVLNGS